ncbi:MAG: hypothetical protein R3E12_06140 [Candidatus Eisenbacteria bacterium]
MAGPRVYAYLIAAAVVGTATAIAGVPWITPVVQTGLCFPVLWRDLERSDLGGAVRHMTFWALVVSICTVEVAIHAHSAAAEAIPRGEAYRIEMFHYIETGDGAEDDPHLFLPQHASHFAATLLASVVTAGLGGSSWGRSCWDT